jgi:hypothetical protein
MTGTVKGGTVETRLDDSPVYLFRLTNDRIRVPQ